MKESDAKHTLSPDGETQLEFVKVPLQFETGIYTNIFAQKNNKTVGQTLNHQNNKTVGQTLNHQRYTSLARLVLPKYASHLPIPLGKFLLEMKRMGDVTYRRFLNKYGDLTYSVFSIKDEKFLNAKGVYAYYVGRELKYIGRCKDSMRKRINQGYGKIHPKNCYLDGQATNCHLNALITQTRAEVSLWLCFIESEEEIEMVERQLLRRYSPPWNIQKA